ncbi:MAG: DUF5329 family protein [Planctomycetota bacterium]
MSSLRSVGWQIDFWARRPSRLLAVMLFVLFCLMGVVTGQEQVRTDYEVRIGEEMRSSIIQRVRSFQQSTVSPLSTYTIHDQIQRYLQSIGGEVERQGWHVVGDFSGRYLVEYKFLVNGEQPVDARLIYELDLESGSVCDHWTAMTERSEEVLLDMIAWFMFLGFQVLIYAYYYVFLFLLDHHPLARRRVTTRPQRVIEQGKLMELRGNRPHSRDRGWHLPRDLRGAPLRALAIALIPLLCVACTSDPTDKADSTPTIVLPADPTEMTIVQRMSESLPGSRGRIRLEIGDITAGQVLTRLAIEDGDPLVPRQSMVIGDMVEFSVDGRRLSLGLTRLVNRLIGDDHAIFHIGTPSVVVTAQIEEFLKRIETSMYTFVRGGSDYDGQEMARYLRRNWATAASEIRTASEFIDRIATENSTTKQQYGVRVGSATVPLAKWLRGR